MRAKVNFTCRKVKSSRNKIKINQLCAAVLGYRFLPSVVKSLQRMESRFGKTYAWTDSTSVLSWLNRGEKAWSIFVANILAESHECTDLKWNHVPSYENPADCASRGVDPSSLKHLSLWWKCPNWLIRRGLREKTEIPNTKEELKRNVLVNMSQVAESQDIITLPAQRSLKRVLQIVAYGLNRIEFSALEDA